MKSIKEIMGKGSLLDMTNKKPKPCYCRICGKEKERVLREIMGIGKVWTTNACDCEVKELKEFWNVQEKKEKDRKIKKMFKLSSSLVELGQFTFENFEVREGTELALKEIKDAVVNFDSRGKLGVMIIGETGNGKTHLTSAGANELIKMGKSVIFITEKDLFSRINSTKNFKNSESFHEIMGACVEADLLIWDDFMSSQKLSDEEKDWVFQIVNGRERSNRPIWATSNLTPQEFNSAEIQYRFDDKGRTWWRLIGNMNCVLNRAKNNRKIELMERMKGLKEEKKNKG